MRNKLKGAGSGSRGVWVTWSL